MSKGEFVATRWWWVRHAPVPDGGRIYGQRDMDCDCSDARVFEAVAATLPKSAHWVTSTLKRTQQTAVAIVAASGGRHAPEHMEALPSLVEQSLGDWQGEERVAFKAQRGLKPTDFWMAPAHERAPNGESYLDLVARVGPTVHQLTDRHGGRNIVSVGHGGTIRAALGLALGLDGDTMHAFTIDNCSVTVIEHLRDGNRMGGGRWRVATVNARPWLPM